MIVLRTKASPFDGKNAPKNADAYPRSLFPERERYQSDGRGTTIEECESLGYAQHSKRMCVYSSIA